MIHGWYLYIVFIAVAIPAGIYCKTQLGTSMANVDWIHGPCELLLTLANLFIVLGLRDALRAASAAKQATISAAAETAHSQAPHTQQQDALADMQYMQQLHSMYSSKHSMEESPAAAAGFEQSTSAVSDGVTNHVIFPVDISRGAKGPRGRDSIVPRAVPVRRAIPAARVTRIVVANRPCRAVGVTHGTMAASVAV
eukprot:GHUV01028950.1.p1 GENE.GHUV01028950.1~~GHUV01028950.1.p1  ORF type:complete len:196 (+),score=55.56 GHUV01028950.1:591-1178(+)